jgi:adenylate cyclase
LRSLVERGDIYKEDGHWERRGVHEIQVPESVRSVIGERVSRLLPETQEILHEASVLGQSFDFGTLQSMGERREVELEEALEEATASGLLRETGRDRYSFSHALVQGTLYGELSSRRRRRLHLAAGEALERLPEPVRTRRAAELAWHFLEGDEPQKGFTYSLLAGDEAETVFAHPEAERHYTAAADLGREIVNPSGEATALERLGNVLWLLARYEEAIEVLERAVRLYEQQHDEEGQRRSIAMIGRLHGERATPEEGVRRLQDAIERLGGAEPSRGLAELYGALGGVLFKTGRFREQLPIAERTVKIAEAVNDEQLVAGARTRFAVALQTVGRLRESLDILEGTIPLAERTNDLNVLALCLHNASECVNLGDFKRAKEYRERDLELVQKLGDPAQIGFRHAFLGNSFFLSGDWHAAREQCERGVRIFESVGISWFGAYPLVCLGQIELAQGQVESGVRHINEALAIVERTEDIQGILMATPPLATHDLLEGRPNQALDRIGKAIETCHRHGTKGTWDTTFLPLLALVHLDLGEQQKAERIASEAIEGWCGSVGMFRVQALRSLGIVMTAGLRFDEACDAFEEALELARSMPWPEEEALNMYELGLTFAAKGELELARAHLHKALSIFERLGAKPQLQRTKTALARI